MTGADRPIVVTTGGSGGHVFPAVACARELARRGRRRVVLLCDDRGARFAPDDVERRVIAAGSPSGPPPARLSGAARLGLGFVQSLRLLRSLRPAVVASFGGYASVPAALAAQALAIPVLVHEQNAVLGRANRLIARRARRVALSFAATARAEAVPPGRRLVTGNPVRPEVVALAGAPYAPPTAEGPLRLLVFGGSQGARVFSDALPAALPRLPEDLRRRLRLVQQCRPEDLERVRSAYAAAGIEAELAAFFADLPARIAAAHLVVGRAGASTVAELTAIGRPSLLAPLPQATEGDQRANARVLADAGAAIVLEGAEATPEGFAAHLAVALARPDRLAAMAAAAAGLARPGAAGALVDAIEALDGGRPSAAAVAGPAAPVGDAG